MEVYSNDTNNKKERKLGEPRIQYFTTTQALTMFLVGLLGLNVFAYIVFYALYAMFPTASDVDLNTYTNFITYIILILILVYLSYSYNKQKFISNIESLKNKNVWFFILFGLILIYIAAILASQLETLIYEWAGIEIAINDNQSSINTMLTAHPILIIIMVTIFAPIVEEIAYRQGLFESVRFRSRVWAYVVTIIVFSLIHFGWLGSFYDTDTQTWGVNMDTLITELIALPSYMGGAAVLSYVYDHENNVISSMFVHGLYNLIGIVATLLLTANIN
jgi:membrane protease YdiL (CAAX protease family)